MQTSFNIIIGFADSSTIFKKSFSDRKGPGLFKF